MTPDDCAKFVTAAQDALYRLDQHPHEPTCRYIPARLSAQWNRRPEPLESECDCGLWRTRESLREAIRRAEGGTASE